VGFFTKDVPKGFRQTLRDLFKNGKWEPNRPELDKKKVAKAAGGATLGATIVVANAAERNAAARTKAAAEAAAKKK